MDIWRTTNVRRDPHPIVDSTPIRLGFASLIYIYGYFERNYGIAMGLGLHSVEHWLRHIILEYLRWGDHGIGTENLGWAFLAGFSIYLALVT